MSTVLLIEDVKADLEFGDPEGKTLRCDVKLSKDRSHGVISIEISTESWSYVKLEDLVDTFSVASGEHGFDKLHGMLWWLAEQEMGPYPRDASREDQLKYSTRIMEIIQEARESFEGGVVLEQVVKQTLNDEARRIRRAEMEATPLGR